MLWKHFKLQQLRLNSASFLSLLIL